jgi:hypothetical protein
VSSETLHGYFEFPLLMASFTKWQNLKLLETVGPA